MPYKIFARSTTGTTVARLDLRNEEIKDHAYAVQLAEDFARTRPHGANGTWTGFVQYYEKKDSIANPLWDKQQGGLRQF